MAQKSKLTRPGRAKQFIDVCSALKKQREMVSRDRNSAPIKAANAALVEAALHLFRSETDAQQKQVMIAAAVPTMSAPLISGLPKGPQGTLHFSNLPYGIIASKADAHYLSLLYDLGLNISWMYQDVFLRAVRRNDIAIQEFLLSTLSEFFKSAPGIGAAGSVESLRVKDCLKAPDFLATYLKALVLAYPKEAERTIGHALATYSGLCYALLYHAGARVNFANVGFMPDMARDLFRNLSNHQIVAFDADGADLAAFCRNEAAMRTAIEMFSVPKFN
jgi:hypothetical protein